MFRPKSGPPFIFRQNPTFEADLHNKEAGELLDFV